MRQVFLPEGDTMPAIADVCQDTQRGGSPTPTVAGVRAATSTACNSQGGQNPPGLFQALFEMPGWWILPSIVIGSVMWAAIILSLWWLLT